MSKVQEFFVTPKGTKLPLLNLRGKTYLQVAHRLVWFREDHPTGVIRTTLKAQQGEGNNEYAVFQAEIHIMTDKGPMLVATAHKKETRGGFEDFLEKAETGAIGRALALLGFGTAFTASELDEGMRLADAPLDMNATTKTTLSVTGSTVGVLTNQETTSPVTMTVVNADNGATSPRRGSFRKNVTVTASTGDDI